MRASTWPIFSREEIAKSPLDVEFETCINLVKYRILDYFLIDRSR